MKNFSIVVAFACGCLAAVALRTAAAAHAATGNSAAAAEQRASVETRLDALERRDRALDLQEMVSSKVVAPFQVVNKAGNPIFSVDTAGANVYGGGKVAASLSGDRGGGRLVASSSSGRSVWLDGSVGPSFSVVESGSDTRGRSTPNTRVELGKGTSAGTYRLKFTSKAGLNIAGIGEDQKTHTGLVLVFDKQ